ncbi:unnamed protein product [Leuciscus chuanchicus]
MAPPLPLILLLMILAFHGVSDADWGVSYSPSHICALKDSTVIMRCTYTYPTGHQVKKVFWAKLLIHGEEPPDLSNDPEYSQRLQYLGDKQQNCTVRLSHVTLKDSHMYYFRFITDKDKWIGYSGVTLTVTDLQVESPERVTEGDSVNLRCKSSCALTDRATFIWYRNSQPLTERRDRNNELLLQSVRREDSGRYSCAVDGHTHISPAVQINVMRVSDADWGVSYSPSHICALKDSTVIMRCTYTYPTGHQIMIAFWTNESIKDVEPPDLSEDPEYSERLQYLGDQQQNCTVRLSHVTLKDSHMYYFRFITDKDKWIGKPGVTLNVTDLQVESPERVTEGDSVNLRCKSSCALTDRATFIWYRNSQPLTERRDRNNELLLQSVRREDSGRYSCAVDGHTHISPEVQLNVMYPPNNVSVLISGSGVIVEGDSVTLNCISDSNPPAEISWIKGGTIVGSGRIYNISKISSDDSGEYKCKSINEHGEKYSDAVTLNVMYPPRSVSVLINGSGVIVEGDSVTLNCISDSNPPALNFSWFKENETSAVGSGQSFSALQSGRFYCQAHNQHGSQRSDTVTVTVHHVAGRNVTVITAASGGVFFIIIIILLLSFIIKKKRINRRSAINESVSDPAVHESGSFEYENLSLQ